ncbi:HET-domain-containing protein, partial [Stipitochalara longipes BDJ]
MTHHGTQNAIYPELDKTSNSIRILELQPDRRGNDLIRCNLIAVSLDDLPEYEALSYMWGEPDGDAQFQIWVNGAPVRVRQNLWYALQRLRLKITGRRLWIDALCINQDNIEERNKQVAFMRHIYQHATFVVIWLGNEISNAEWTASPSNSLSLNPVRPLATFGEVRNQWYQGMNVPFVTTLLQSRYSIFWEGIAYICALPYWQRLWIVQEICL